MVGEMELYVDLRMTIVGIIVVIEGPQVVGVIRVG